MKVQIYNGKKYKLNSVKNNKSNYNFFITAWAHAAVSDISIFAPFVVFKNNK